MQSDQRVAVCDGLKKQFVSKTLKTQPFKQHNLYSLTVLKVPTDFWEFLRYFQEVQEVKTIFTTLNITSILILSECTVEFFRDSICDSKTLMTNGISHYDCVCLYFYVFQFYFPGVSG